MSKKLSGLAALALVGITIMMAVPYKVAYAVESNNSETSCNYDGWKNKNGNWYYYDNGIMKSGWIYDNGKWYYLGYNGVMAHDCFVGEYYVNSSGEWVNNIISNIESTLYNDNLNEKMKELGYSSMEREFNYNSSDNKYSDAYRYIWYDGKEDNLEYAVVNIFDSGSCSISVRKNGSIFDENLKKIFNWILPYQGEELFNIIKNNPSDQTITMDGRKVIITKFDDSIGITIE